MSAIEVGFWKIAAERPSWVAVVEPDGTEVTAAQLLSNANQLVHGLRALGLETGACIATVLDNSAAMMEAFLAAHQAGWYVTPINWHLTAAEIAYILDDCDAAAVIATPRVGDAVVAACVEADIPPAARLSTGGALAGFRSLDDIKAGQPTSAPAERTAGATMTYTSGTTGKPKGVRRPLVPAPPETVATQQALFLALFGIMPGSPGVHIVGAPLYHTAVLNFASNHLHLGHSLVLMDKWEPEAMLRLIERHKVTSSHMVPTQFNRLLKLPDEVRARYDVSSLSHIIHGAAPCSIDTKRRMLEWWGPCIHEYYAASEGGGTSCTPAEWQARPGTVGKAWPISEIRILDDEHQPCPPGTAGTVWIRMGTHKFEYHRDQKKTGDAWRDGFFTVGDAGYLDADGYLFLCDRKSDMIISGGVNIYPAEIEAVLLGHPEVVDVAVFGVPDDDWGEQVRAVVQPASAAAAGPALSAAILDYAASRLAKFKLPRAIDFIAEMPRDPNGKLYKRKLRDPYWAGRDRAI
ncbi:MAG TPA: acyl-CoA synthetase [Kofleriaceae bacterium]|nr:acyl-CoA synthetase [Kofleriaceae bacterium]